MKFVFCLAFFAAFSLFGANPARADLLLSIDFAGSGPLATSYPSSDGQFSFTNPGVTYSDPLAAVRVIGGGSGTASWVYAGTTASPSAANVNLFESSTANFGSPTRFDVALGLASAGNAYRITGAELVMRANNQTGARWSMGYRDASSTTQIVGSLALATPGGDPTETFFIDLSGENLSATDSAATFGLASNGGIRFLFNNTVAGTANDNFQVQSIRLLGNVTAVPEPSSLAMMGIAGLGGAVMVWRRRKQRA